MKIDLLMTVTFVHTFELKLGQRMKIKTLPLILLFCCCFFVLRLPHDNKLPYFELKFIIIILKTEG